MSKDTVSEAQGVIDGYEEALDQVSAAGASTQAQEQLKSTRRIRNDEKWESLKAEIYQIYMTEDNTLRNTMNAIFEKYGFKARYALPVPRNIVGLKANRILGVRESGRTSSRSGVSIKIFRVMT
jgi:Clr5 domain